MSMMWQHHFCFGMLKYSYLDKCFCVHMCDNVSLKTSCGKLFTCSHLICIIANASILDPEFFLNAWARIAKERIHILFVFQKANQVPPCCFHPSLHLVGYIDASKQGIRNYWSICLCFAWNDSPNLILDNLLELPFQLRQSFQAFYIFCA